MDCNVYVIKENRVLDIFHLALAFTRPLLLITIYYQAPIYTKNRCNKQTKFIMLLPQKITSEFQVYLPLQIVTYDCTFLHKSFCQSLFQYILKYNNVFMIDDR